MRHARQRSGLVSAEPVRKQFSEMLLESRGTPENLVGFFSTSTPTSLDQDVATIPRTEAPSISSGPV